MSAIEKLIVSWTLMGLGLFMIGIYSEPMISMGILLFYWGSRVPRYVDIVEQIWGEEGL